MTTLFLHFFLFFTIACVIPAVHSHCIEDQQLSLLHFKNSLVFDSSSSSNPIAWNSSTDCCSWLGVTCSTNGHVVGLDLSSEFTPFNLDNSSSLFQLQNLTELTELNLNGANMSAQGTHWCQAISSLLNLRILSLSRCDLSGPICESLAQLQSLSKINLEFNNFYAPVPRLFANFSKLISLNLRTSNLQGTFPKEIFQIPNLQMIDLSFNEQLGGSFPEFSKNGSLQSMDLSYTKFSGILPNSIGNLKMLSELDLSSCSFTGSVPRLIANLTQLVNLDMSGNMFNGPISAIHWESLVNLDFLELSNNRLEGSIPSTIFSLPLLRELVLSDNLFSGQVPEFSNNSSPLLEALELGNNNLEGQIPTSIFNLQGLDYLNLSSNNFSGFPFHGPQQPRNLSSLDLSHNSLFDYNGTDSSFLKIQTLLLASNKLRSFPDFLRNQSRLWRLDLSNNQIQGQIPNWIWRLKFLKLLNLSCNSLKSLEAPLLNYTIDMSLLDLHSNQLQGRIPMFVSSHYLDYSRNNFSSSIPTDIGDFISAKFYLSLSSNNLHGTIPNSICNASVKVLNLSNNSLSGIIPQCLTQSQSHSVIDLSRNNLNGTIPDNFLEDFELRTLDLNRNQIQGQFPKSLVNCSRLQVLNLGNNQITDTFPCFLMSISTLRVVVLRSNKIYGSFRCPKTKSSWSVLQIIDLAHNRLNGEIPGTSLVTWQKMKANKDDFSTNLGFSFLPDEIDGLAVYYGDTITTIMKGLELDLIKIITIFTLIDFSCNNFNGSIPEEMGQLNSLYVLNLSGNALTGEIPSSFGNMQQLESLDLSQNQLSGQIPRQFTNLTFLAFLNVSNNQLTGRIPTSTQFSTFPYTSFEGNKGLWGPPLTKDTVALLPPPMLNGKLSNPNSGDEIDWDIISVEIGFTCGLGITVGSLLFSRRWRKWYYRAMCNIMLKIFPQLEQRFGNHRRHVYVNTRWRH